eukprot:scaffold54358_cov36-Cyclotella_meneghiniana.AAC.3
MAAPPPNHAAVVLQSMAATDQQQRKLFSRPSPLSRLSQAVAGCHLPSIRRQKNIGPLVSGLMLMSHPRLPLFPFRQNENIICPAGKRQIHVMGDWHQCDIGDIWGRGVYRRVGEGGTIWERWQP